jgi:hypothetical protein
MRSGVVQQLYGGHTGGATPAPISPAGADLALQVCALEARVAHTSRILRCVRSGDVVTLSAAKGLGSCFGNCRDSSLRSE